jgi:hypothetical protein
MMQIYVYEVCTISQLHCFTLQSLGAYNYMHTLYCTDALYVKQNVGPNVESGILIIPGFCKRIVYQRVVVAKMR